MTPLPVKAMVVVRLCAALVAAAPASARTPLLPGEVVQFYEDVNFAGAFSNATERRHVRAVHRRQRLEAVQSESGWPRDRTADSLTPREQEIALRLLRIEERTLRIDDIAVLGWGVREGAPAAELIRVLGRQQTGHALHVRIEVWPITAEYSARLRDDYDRRGRRIVESVPPPEGRAGQPRPEVHRWRRVDGQWMRMEGVAVGAPKGLKADASSRGK
jgi:hypothetical protein